MTGQQDKLLERLKNTKAGWSDRDLWKLLTAFNFSSRESKHTVYYHPTHPDLTIVIPRGRELLPVYPREVEKLIKMLQGREMEEP